MTASAANGPAAPETASPAFHFGPIPVFGDLILAPMDGYSDLPFRLICRRLGSAISYTEFISVINLLGGHPRIRRKFAYAEEERPVVFQLLDDDPVKILEAVKMLEADRPDAIDVNMGCPARGIAGRGAGAGLLRTPLKVARIFRTLRKGTSLPLSGKIRLGWDAGDRKSALLAAHIVQEEGGALVAVHGRTKSQGYAGEVDLDAIAEIRSRLSIPVLANGDVKTPADVTAMLARTGCAGVMIGRGAVGNPWIFSRRGRADVPPAEVLALLLSHLEENLAFFGVPDGLITFRKHADRYLKPYGIERETRLRLLTTLDAQEFRDTMRGLSVFQPGWSANQRIG